MEVEFDVQMTSADLYDYMLHHTFTSPSGLIGAVAGALMIVAGFAGSGLGCRRGRSACRSRYRV